MFTLLWFSAQSLFLLASARTVSLQLRIFRDTFNDGNATDGMPGTWVPGASPEGSRDASSGDFRSTHTGGMSTLLEELYGLRDVSIRTEVTFDTVSGNRDFVGVWARSPRIDNPPSYWGAIDTNGLLAIGITTDNVPTFLSSVATSLNPVGEDVHLRFEVINDQISLFAWQDGMEPPSSPQLITTHSQLVEGAGIGTFLSPNASGGANSVQAVFRWFELFDPTVLPCDLNRNGNCDVADLNEILTLGDLSMGIPIVADNDRFDVNADFVIDIRDVDAWLSRAAAANGLISPYLLGDANLDGRVDSTDLNAVALNWNQANTDWSGGDFTSDGFVNAQDLNVLALNWQESVPLTAAPSLPVPEPSTFVHLMAWAFCLLILTRRMTSAIFAEGNE